MDESTTGPDLIQIARRKLAELDVPTEAGDQGHPLTGILPDEGTPIINPLSGQAIGEIRFYVEGHDKLHITHPASIAGVPALGFFTLASRDALRRAIATRLEHQARVVRQLTERMRKLGFECESRDRLGCVQAIFDVELIGTVQVEATEEGVSLVQCTPIGKDAPTPLGGLSIDLDSFDDSCDVEIHLSQVIEKAPKQPKRPAPKPAADSGHRPLVSSQPSAPSAVSLAWLLDTIGPGFFGRKTLSLARNLIVDDRPARFELDLKDRKTMGARVFVADQLRWQGPVNVAQLGDLESFVAGAIERASPEEPELELSNNDTQGLIPPIVNEVWLMGVEVVKEDPADMHYVGLNARGGAQGAPRVLPRATFEKVFSPHGPAYRMFVRVTEMSGVKVTYQRLNADREPVAAPRQLPLAVFLDTFIAEATA